MGDVPAGHISKGIIHSKVDALVNHKDAQGKFDKRPAFLAALIDATTSDQYINLLKTQAGVLDKEANYLNDYFYKLPERWWEDIQPIFPVFRQGFIKALEEAGDSLLLDSYWLPVAGSEVVEVFICKSATQVTRIFLTPPPPPSKEKMKQRTMAVPIWVVNAGSGATSQLQMGSSTTDAVVERVEGNVITWHKTEFPESTQGATAV